MQADELIREVDEELQRERLERLWLRYRVPLLALVVGAVLATAGWSIWQRLEARAREAEAMAFAAAQALAAEGPKAAADAFAEVARESDPGFAALARFRAAAAQAEAGDRVGAAATLDALAGDGSADSLLRGLAALQSAMLGADDAAPAELRAKLEPLAAPGAPWRYEARELLALAAIRAGEEARGRELLDGLAQDAGAPTNLRRRAGELRDALAARRLGS